MTAGADAEIAAAYDARAAEYVALAGTIAQLDARDAAVIAAWRDGTAGVLLDAGCGPGQWTQLLARGEREARGIDLSAAFVASARHRHPGIRFDVGSFRDLPLEERSVGGILAWYSLIHVPPADLPEILAEFARVLVPGGSLLIGFFEGEPRERFAHAIAPAYFWSADALAAVLAETGLEIVSSESREREPGEVSTRPHGSLIARSTPG
ncbi:ubiquinone/menaquinone biosynthesis C-methylase UbiE [Microbacterium foliorum]|uniref:class I SAM-dependent methyltransferase n=1 Tax=Microbacterium foliorum TaxID=104336 RepID=UPI0020A1AB96|nr:class I SAM-dependent methyltransferase [Microbacterium foliorum]MCP1430624.1 ubiquinone/menaquinone biosynthesis C-methylase UbiE [Microbacterium foliorum]